VAQSASESSGIAGRYATALFELAEESGSLETAERDVAALKEALAESEELRTVISSPIYGREETGQAIAAVADAMGLSPLVKNVLGLMAAKRRLFTLPNVCDAFSEMLARKRGEVTAEVVSAQKLTKAQRNALSQALAGAVGREVKLETAVDETLIGGLVVKLGSKLIDTSIRSKLASLKNAMREVG
jgi:F-type H+-transporting ATPase subunit delta